MEGKPLSEVVATGDVRASLEAIRERLAGALEGAKYAKDVPVLAKQLCDVIALIEKLPDPEVRSPVDDLTKRRAGRRAAAKGAESSAV